MQYYIEINLLPDPDIDLGFLWSKVYMQLHLALVENKRDDDRCDFGVSFPSYLQNSQKQIRSLGRRLRVFARSEQALADLRLPDFLMRLQDYVHVKSIKPVELKDVKSYAFFSRLNPKGSPESLARRRAERLNIPYAEALAFFQDETRKQSDHKPYLYPSVRMKSLGTNGEYGIVVVKTESKDGLVFGNGFSTYGLSSDSSVPIF